MEQKRKVLVVASNSSMNSGASHSLVTFVYIINQRHQDVQLDVLLPCHGDIENALKKANIRYRVIPYSNALWKKPVGKCQCGEIGLFLRRCLNFAARIKIDNLVKQYELVHINAITTDMGAEEAQARGVKVIWHIREFLEEDLGQEFFDRADAIKMLNRADMRIAISKSVADKYTACLGREVEVVYNGIDIKRFYNEHSDLFEAPKIKILMMGRMCPQKGQHILLEALARLKDQGVDCFQIRLFGQQQEGYCKDLLRIIEKNHLDVELKERTDNARQEYTWADVTCVCSVKEAFGRVTVEGMLAKTLVIGANSGGTAELVMPYQTGLLFQNENAESLAEQLRYCAEHLDEMKKIAANGQMYAKENFSANSNAEKIYDYYKELLERQS